VENPLEGKLSPQAGTVEYASRRNERRRAERASERRPSSVLTRRSINGKSVMQCRSAISDDRKKLSRPPTELVTLGGGVGFVLGPITGAESQPVSLHLGAVECR
jgi:hypothetical protein